MELGLSKPLSFQSHQADGKAGGIEFQHHRRQGSWGQSLQIGQSQIRKFSDVGIRAGPGLEINPDDAHAQQRARLHVINTAGQGEETLQRVGDVSFDVLRGHAGIERGHHHFGQIDRGEQIHRHASQAGHADDHQRETDHDNEIRVAYGKARHALSP